MMQRIAQNLEGANLIRSVNVSNETKENFYNY